MTMETVYVIAIAFTIAKIVLAWFVWHLLGLRIFPPGFWQGLRECWKIDQRKHLEN